MSPTAASKYENCKLETMNGTQHTFRQSVCHHVGPLQAFVQTVFLHDAIPHLTQRFSMLIKFDNCIKQSAILIRVIDK